MQKDKNYQENGPLRKSGATKKLQVCSYGGHLFSAVSVSMRINLVLIFALRQMHWMRCKKLQKCT